MTVTVYKINKNAVPRTVSVDFAVDLTAWQNEEVLSYGEDSMLDAFRAMYDALGGWDKSYDNVSLVLQPRAIVQCVTNPTQRSRLLALLTEAADDELLYAVIA